MTGHTIGPQPNGPREGIEIGGQFRAQKPPEDNPRAFPTAPFGTQVTPRQSSPQGETSADTQRLPMKTVALSDDGSQLWDAREEVSVIAKGFATCVGVLSPSSEGQIVPMKVKEVLACPMNPSKQLPEDLEKNDEYSDCEVDGALSDTVDGVSSDEENVQAIVDMEDATVVEET